MVTLSCWEFVPFKSVLHDLSDFGNAFHRNFAIVKPNYRKDFVFKKLSRRPKIGFLYVGGSTSCSVATNKPYTVKIMAHRYISTSHNPLNRFNVL